MKTQKKKITATAPENPLLPYLFIIFVVASLFIFYTAYDKAAKTIIIDKLIDVVLFKDTIKSLNEINKVFALAGIGLIAISFILGPVSKFWPDIFAKYLYFRKPVGLAGFILGFVHGIYSAVVFYNMDINAILLSLPAIFGLVGTAIFIVMSATSNKTAMEKLGYEKWKAVQTFGYFGLLSITIHFLMIESKPDVGFDVRPYGLLFFYLAVIALILRIVMIFVKTEPRKNYGEHFGGPKQ